MGPPLKMTVSGFEQIAAELKRAIVRYEAAARVGLYETAVELAMEAERRTPVDSGELVESMYVTAPVSGAVEVEVGYGSEHAVPAHENPAHHDRGESKYLQRAVDASAPVVLERLRDRIAGAVESNRTAYTSRFPATPQITVKLERRRAGIATRRLKRQRKK